MLLTLSLLLGAQLAACGGGGGGSTPPANPAARITAFSANPATVASGASATLSWATQDAQSCTLNGQPVAAASGSQSSGALTATSSFRLDCLGLGGNASQSLSVTVLPPLAAGWLRLTDLPSGVAKFGTAALNGRLYLLGGYDTSNAVRVYDIPSNQWSSGPTLPRGTDNVAGVAAGGKVWAVGGEAATSLQAFDPVAGSWSLAPALPRLRFAATAAEIAGRLHVAGGWNANNAASASLTTHDAFDIAGNSWTAGPWAPLATARNAAAGGVIGDKWYVVGGRAPGIRASDQQPLASLEVFDSATGTWSAGPAMPTARGSLAAAVLGGRLYVFGGEGTAGVLDTVQRFDPATQAWETLPAMPYRAHGLGAVVVGDAIYVMGGFTGAADAVGSESRALYRYTPQ